MRVIAAVHAAPGDGSARFLYLSQEDVIAAGGLDMSRAIADIEQVFAAYDRQDFVLQKKIVLSWGDENGTGRINGILSHIGRPFSMAGIKWIGSNPSNPSRHGLPRATALLLLNDPDTKLPLAVTDATVISAMRTRAAAW